MSERKKQIECPDCGILPGSYKCMPVGSFLESFQFGMNWPGKKDEQPILAYLELEQSLGIRKLARYALFQRETGLTDPYGNAHPKGDLLEIPECFQSCSELGAILQPSEDMNETSSFSLFHSFDETARSQVAELVPTNPHHSPFPLLHTSPIPSSRMKEERFPNLYEFFIKENSWI